MCSSDLHVFHDDYDWYIASNASDAVKEWENHQGGDVSRDPSEFLPFEQLPDNSDVTVFWGDDDWPIPEPVVLPQSASVLHNLNEGKHFVTMPCKDWAKTFGKGFLCSTEW